MVIRHLENEIELLRAQKDAAYLERNQVVAAFAKMADAMGWRVVLARTVIEGWSEDWCGCIFIETPAGQLSWHFHDSQAYLFDGLPNGTAKWDGHDTPEKYRRLAVINPPHSPASCEMSTFEDDIRHAINCHSKENGSNTPDWMLAAYLADCLTAWDKAVTAREKWYGRGDAATSSPPSAPADQAKEMKGE